MTGPPADVATPEDDRGRAVLAFRIGEEDHGIDVSSVLEVLRWRPPAALPHAPPHIRGVFHQRGRVLPLVDLAARLGHDPIEPTARHLVVVVATPERRAGLLVEGVPEFLVSTSGEVGPAPSDGGPAGPIRGLVALGDRTVRLLDLGVVLARGCGSPVAGGGA